jgi:hypothetical protein
VTVYPLSLEEDVSTKKKTVGTHTSYMSCCTFPNSDQQVCIVWNWGMSMWTEFIWHSLMISAGSCEHGAIRHEKYLDYLSN